MVTRQKSRLVWFEAWFELTWFELAWYRNESHLFGDSHP